MTKGFLGADASICCDHKMSQSYIIRMKHDAGVSAMQKWSYMLRLQAQEHADQIVRLPVRTLCGGLITVCEHPIQQLEEVQHIQGYETPHEIKCAAHVWEDRTCYLTDVRVQDCCCRPMCVLRA